LFGKSYLSLIAAPIRDAAQGIGLVTFFRFFLRRVNAD
jgi:hypothetical protein